MDQKVRISKGSQFVNNNFEIYEDTEEVFIKLENELDSEQAIHIQDAQHATSEYEECRDSGENNNDFYDIKNELTKINQRLDSLEEFSIYQRGATEKILGFMADLIKFMKRNSSSQETFQRSTKMIESDRCLTEFENMKPIETEEGLLELELKLKDLKFNENFKRYLRRVYDINGKRDGSAFFKTLIRKLISPLVLSPYSWEGISRKKCSETNSVEALRSTSFKYTFPTFISFIASILQESDHQYTIEQSCMDFSKYLRQKNTEIKRFLEGGLKRRTSTKRKHSMFRNPIDVKRAKEYKESYSEITFDEDMDNGENDKTTENYERESMSALEVKKHESIRIENELEALWDKNPVLSTEKDFEKFEEKLDDANVFESTVNFMVTIGGSDHIELTIHILKRFLADSLAGNFNMAGKNRKGEPQKRRFVDTRLLLAIIKAARKKCETKKGLMFDEDLLKKSTIATWLTQAPTREKRARNKNQKKLAEEEGEQHAFEFSECSQY